MLENKNNSHLKLKKKQTLWWIIATAVFSALFIILTLALSPFLLGMEITYSLTATILFRIGYVFFGLAVLLMILSKPMMRWFHDN